jgi:hypothetical protein
MNIYLQYLATIVEYQNIFTSIYRLKYLNGVLSSYVCYIENGKSPAVPIGIAGRPPTAQTVAGQL